MTTQIFFKKIWQKFSKNFCASAQNANRFVVAEDDDLVAILDGMKAAPAQFSHEAVLADNSIDIAGASAYRAAVTGGFGVKDAAHPNVRWESRGKV